MRPLSEIEAEISRLTLEKNSVILDLKDKERKAAALRQQKLEESGVPDVSNRDDYAYVDTEDLCFYYGYEEARCPKHGDPNDCPDSCGRSEWNFVCNKNSNGAEILRLSKSELAVDYREPCEMLLLGIGVLINRGILQWNNQGKTHKTI